MAKIGVDKLFFAVLNEETDVLGATAPTYETPVQIAKAIQVTLTPNNVEGALYADDAQDEYESATTGYDVSINTNDLLPGKEAMLLGRKVDTLGGVAAGTGDIAPYGAIMYRQKRSKGVGGGYQYRVLYKTRFTPFAEDAQTQGENINFQTPTITGKSLSRAFDGEFNYKLDDDGKKPAVTAVTSQWFTKVTEPGTELEEG